MDMPSWFNFDFEHNKIVENLPMYFLMGVLLLTFMPGIPTEIKSPIVLIGLVGAVPFMVVIDKFAQWESAKYMPIKARIMGPNLKIERTFFCYSPVGSTSSTKNQSTGVYTTPFRLGVKTKLPKFGLIDRFELHHKRPLDERCRGTNGHVMFMGVEVEHPRVVLAEFWVGNPPSRLDSEMNIIPQFFLMSGSEDYDISHKRPQEDYAQVTAVE